MADWSEDEDRPPLGHGARRLREWQRQRQSEPIETDEERDYPPVATDPPCEDPSCLPGRMIDRPHRHVSEADRG